MNTKAVLETKNINKYFYEPTTFHVLKNINIAVKYGEFVSIKGKSGSGKSTLLYILSTMDTDYNGELYMHGEKITGKKQSELARFRNHHIGFVFQFHYLLEEFSAIKNVMLPAEKLGKYSQQEIEEQAYEKLVWLGIGDQARKPASKLSGGQQQRVAIARALINNPTIIMGDEPTGNLDTYNTQLVFDIFRQLSAERHQSIIAVSHDPDFAKNCDRIIEMQDGEIV